MIYMHSVHPQYPASRLALLTAAETATLLGIHPKTVLRLVARGELEAVRIGSRPRFRPESIRALIERGRRPIDGEASDTLHTVAGRLEIREKLAAILAELDRLDVDVDVPHTIAVGLLEELEDELRGAPRGGEA